MPGYDRATTGLRPGCRLRRKLDARSSLLESSKLAARTRSLGQSPGSVRALSGRWPRPRFKVVSGSFRSHFHAARPSDGFHWFSDPPKIAAALFGWFSLVFRCSPKQPPKSCWFSLVFQNCSREQPPCRENQKTRDCFVVFRPRPLRKNQNRKTRKPMNKSGRRLPD